VIDSSFSGDPKLVIALLCLVAAALVVSLVMRLTHRRGAEEENTAEPALEPGLRTVSFLRPVAARAPERAAAGRPGVKTIAIIHDFGNPNGNATRNYLTIREAFEVLAKIREAGENTPIDIVLHTPGGEASACELIAAALKDRPNTTAFIPYYAMSAGTIISLACEKVVMGRHACLGPIDTQFMGIPADSFQRLIKEKPIQNIEDEIVLISYIVEKEQRNARVNACSLLNKAHFGPDNVCRITDFLVSGDLPHSEHINREKAQELGVNVVGEDCPEEIYRLVEDRLRLLQDVPLYPESELFDPEFRADSTAKPE
jgi:hypothetical protein